MEKVRLGIVGLGNMGRMHAAGIAAGKVPGCVLGAVCDRQPVSLSEFPDVPGFAESGSLISSGLVDAVVICTPHYAHTEVGIEALNAGLHVLVEKPISVHKADCERLLESHRGQIFTAMFNQRTDPSHGKLRGMIRSGELGRIRRINWTITDWFRTETYYASGGWRATWAGEGGGVLLNQSPHQLDLWQWFFGMPARVRAFCGIGRYHSIEVEDDVTAYLEYADGTTGIFITSTGEAPGTNRLEVAAERGRVILEKGRIEFLRNEVPMSEFSRSSRQAFAAPEFWKVEIPISGSGGQHVAILENFTRAILFGEPLIAPAAEGIHSVELANAMILSSFLNETIELPLSSERYARFLQERIEGSTKVKKARTETMPQDFLNSFPGGNPHP